VRDELLHRLSGGEARPRPAERRPVVVGEVDEWKAPGGPRVAPGTRLPAIALAAVAFPLGLLVGWLIWG
jgi:hypothetical protein